MTINFYPERHGKTSTRKLTIYLRAQNKTIQKATDIRVNIEKWNKERQRVSKGHENAAQINSAINSLSNLVESIFNDFNSEYPMSDFSSFKPYLHRKIEERKKGITSNSESPDYRVVEVLDDFIETRTTQLSDSAIKQYKCLKDKLLQYEERYLVELRFSDLTMSFFDRLYGDFVSVYQLSNVTIKSYFKSVNAFLHRSFKRGVIDKKITVPLSFKAPQTRAVALNKQELLMLMDAEFDEKRYSEVRDVFCFACYTGARFSDVATIRREQLTGTHWQYRSPKTGKIISVPLQAEAQRILQKYADNPKPLPIRHERATRTNIKKICQIVGIAGPTIKETYIGGNLTEESVPKYEMVGFHTARRTFATLALNAGQPPALVMKITGHSNISTLMRYVKTTAEDVTGGFGGAWF
jgi:integrase